MTDITSPQPSAADLAAVTPERHELATYWHGGQASMLYAVASTGALTRGTVRPYGCDTDDEWSEHLRDRLARELREIADADDADGADREIAAAWLAELGHEEA